MKGFYNVTGAAVNPQVSINNDHFLFFRQESLLKIVVEK